MLREVTAARPALAALGAPSSSARPSAAAARKKALRGISAPQSSSSGGGRSSVPLQRVRAISTEQPPVRESDILSSIDQPLPVYSSVDGGGGDPSGSGSPSRRPRVVVLGSGWGAMSFVKALSPAQAREIDLTVISPRNYFLYTPLLPAVATGTVEERSIVEPVRKVLGGKGAYFEAVCHSIDPEAKKLVCCFPKDAGLDEACFQVPYDVLVMSVGCTNNTFGVKGVEEHAFFFKSIEDAARLRRHVSECFERAALPQTPPEERARLLSFVVCGGGPTGVEVAAELHDMINDDLVKVYPDIIQDCRVRIIELQDHLLSTYDRAISEYTDRQFERAGIELVLNSKVLEVCGNGTGKGFVRVKGPDGKETTIDYGACVWSTGVAIHPLVKQLQGKLAAGSQTHFRSVVTTPWLEVVGSGGSIFAIGDAATIEQNSALAKADELFARADTDGDGAVDLEELRILLKDASGEYEQFAEHARFLETKYGFARWGGMASKVLEAARGRGKEDAAAAAVGPGGAAAAAAAAPKTPAAAGVTAAVASGQQSALDTLDEDTALTKEEFHELMASIDRGLRALPATAQVAKSQGEYLAKLVSSGALWEREREMAKKKDEEKTAAAATTSSEGEGEGESATEASSSSSPSPLPLSIPAPSHPPYKYRHKGSLAYVGRDRAVMDIPVIGPIFGLGAGVLWRSYETISQISPRNFVLVSTDWVRTKVFGRDISRV